MGYIYKITNKINGKVYIGQTINPIKVRMYKHYSQANKENVTGIDAAIKKYGKSNFEVEELCKCSNEELNDLEQFYIKKFNSYYNGYNLTLGGQGSQSLDLNEEEVIEKYKKLKTIKEVAKYFNCCEKVISNILKNNDIKSDLHFQVLEGCKENLKKGRMKEYNHALFKEGDRTKKVLLIELNKEFASLKECSQWLIDNKYSKASTMELARKSLSRALNGDRSTYCGFHFEFINK